MRQIDDPNFHGLLRPVRTGSLTDANITNLNNRVASNFSLYNLLKNTVIIQKYKTRLMINLLQDKYFAYQPGRNLIIFPAHHFNRRKNTSERIIYYNIVKI